MAQASMTTNPNLNPNSNPHVDPLIFCRATARSWSLAVLSIKIVGSVTLFFIAVYALRMLAYAETSGPEPANFDYRDSSWEDKQILINTLKNTFYAVLAFEILSLIFYGMSVRGIREENLDLVTFWVVWSVLAPIGDAILVIIMLSKLPDIAKSPQIIISFITTIPFNILSIRCALAFRKRVKGRQSVPNVSYSA